MNSSCTAPRTYRSRLERAILKIHPVSCLDPDLNALTSGPGSGSLGEFIEKIDSERSDKPLRPTMSRKRDTYGNYFALFEADSATGCCQLLLFPGSEQHVAGRHTAAFAIFCVQDQIIFQQLVFSGVAKRGCRFIDRFWRTFQLQECASRGLVQFNQ